MTINWILNAHTRFTFTDCKFQVCVSVFIWSSLSISFSCICVYAVLCAKIIRILTILLWFLVHFRHDYQMDFLYILGSHLIDGKCQVCVSIFICAHLCENDSSSSVNIYTVLCVKIIWMLTILLWLLVCFDTTIKYIFGLNTFE